MSDEEGYLTQDKLEKIENWDYKDIEGFFEYIENLWFSEWRNKRNFRLVERKTNLGTETEYHLSTEKWSRNEDIIQSMKKNTEVWRLTWYESRKGGHYIFKNCVAKIKNDKYYSVSKFDLGIIQQYLNTTKAHISQLNISCDGTLDRALLSMMDSNFSDCIRFVRRLEKKAARRNKL
jgi:hypothetical protein